MARNAFVCFGLAASALFLASASALAQGNTKQQIAKLNQITGTDPAQNALKSILDDKSQAKSLVAAALPLAKDPQKLGYQASLILALAAADLKDLPSSEAFFRNCIQQATKLQSVSKLLQSFGGLIDVYYENKKYDETARLCQELINLKTDDGKERIVLFAYTNKRTNEIEFYEGDNFNTTEPLQPFVYRQLVQVLSRQGKYKEAHEILNNLIKQGGDWKDRQLKGWLYREAGEYDEAAKTYEDVIERLRNDRQMSKKDRTAYVERNQYILSNIYVDLNQIDKASEILQELLKAHPDDPGYNNDLGYIWADHDRNLDEAEKLIRKALEEDRKRRKADPTLEQQENGAYLDSLGWVLYKKKDYKEAKKILVQAVEDKNAQHLEIYDHLGDVLIQLGERDAAVKAWREGLEHMGEGKRDQDRKRLVEGKIKKHASQ